MYFYSFNSQRNTRVADKSLAQLERKPATTTEDLSFIYPIYNHNWTNISTIKASIKRNILTIKQDTGVLISLYRPEKKQATATEDFEFHISYL